MELGLLIIELLTILWSFRVFLCVFLGFFLSIVVYIMTGSGVLLLITIALSFVAGLIWVLASGGKKLNDSIDSEKTENDRRGT